MRRNKFMFFILLIAGSIYSQAPNLKWIKTFESPDQSVYIDTSSIKLFENQISVISLTFFKEPQFISSIKKKASNLKSQILFNPTSKKYTVIGNLYYDKNLKILGESSSSGFSVGTATFTLPIDSNKVMAAIFNKSVDYLISRGFISADFRDFYINAEKVSALTKDSLDVQKQKDAVSISKTKPSTDKFVEKKIANTLITTTTTQPKREITKKEEYDFKSERNPYSTIFTDGQKYCFQVSSWRNKSKAESEVRKIKGQGHNVFMVEAYLKQKGGTWYRVRIGYFNSAQETEDYMRRMK